MTKTNYFILTLGFILFIGSILAFITLNLVSGFEQTVEIIYWQRLFISKMIYFMTIPGICLIAAGNIVLIKKNELRPLSEKKDLVISVILFLIIINSSFLIIPFANMANDSALQQVKLNALIPDYIAYKSKEDLFGAINFLLGTTLLVLFIKRKKQADD